MVRLNRIYTRTGDDGTTGLGDGTRLPKDHLRIEAYGTVDELSSVIGLAVAEGSGGFDDELRAIQNDLFDVGSDLCVPGDGDEGQRIDAGYVTRLEGWIDAHNERLEPLQSFVLPGGTAAAARLHLARTVCRRAERICVALAALEGQTINLEVVHYLNRLSDLLFVLARCANDDGKGDVLWQPGAGKSS
jgi:cob(I)alamin adenosyltransferase